MGSGAAGFEEAEGAVESHGFDEDGVGVGVQRHVDGAGDPARVGEFVRFADIWVFSGDGLVGFLRIGERGGRGKMDLQER